MTLPCCPVPNARIGALPERVADSSLPHPEIVKLNTVESVTGHIAPQHADAISTSVAPAGAQHAVNIHNARLVYGTRLARIWRAGLAALLMLLGSSGLAHAADDCFMKAAVYQGVNPSILRAIAWYESKGDASVVNRNANGSVDVGQLQINSIHFGDLAKQGVPHTALTDACVNVFVASWLLKQKMVKYGNTWRAIGAYHSESPKLRDAYARNIQKILVDWGELQPAGAVM